MVFDHSAITPSIETLNLPQPAKTPHNQPQDLLSISVAYTSMQNMTSTRPSSLLSLSCSLRGISSFLALTAAADVTLRSLRLHALDTSPIRRPSYPRFAFRTACRMRRSASLPVVTGTLGTIGAIGIVCKPCKLTPCPLYRATPACMKLGLGRMVAPTDSGAHRARRRGWSSSLEAVRIPKSPL